MKIDTKIPQNHNQKNFSQFFSPKVWSFKNNAYLCIVIMKQASFTDTKWRISVVA